MNSLQLRVDPVAQINITIFIFFSFYMENASLTSVIITYDIKYQIKRASYFSVD